MDNIVNIISSYITPFVMIPIGIYLTVKNKIISWFLIIICVSLFIIGFYFNWHGSIFLLPVAMFVFITPFISIVIGILLMKRNKVSTNNYASFLRILGIIYIFLGLGYFCYILFVTLPQMHTG